MSGLIDCSYTNSYQQPSNTSLSSSQTSSSPPVSSTESLKSKSTNIKEKLNSDLNVSLNSTSENLGLYNSQGVVPNSATQPNVVSKGSFVANGGAVEVNIMNSDSGYDNKIYWSTDNFKTRNYIGIDNQTGTFNIGTFAAGTKIDFGIDNQVGGFYRTGEASSNVDNFQHAQAEASASGVKIGFEDLAGGGDKDFNDAIINVRNLPLKAQAPKDNRSGLGDGTNPGKGSGTANSPNQGTNNPHNSVTVPSADAAKKLAAEQAAQKTPAPAAKKAADESTKKTTQVTANKAAVEAAAKKPVGAVAKKAAAELTAPKAVDTAAKKATYAAALNASQVAKKETPAVSAIKSITHTTKSSTNPIPPVVVSNPVTQAKNFSENRSGLGDGTNPGKGSGTNNSPNVGTLNPSASHYTTADARLLSMLRT